MNVRMNWVTHNTMYYVTRRDLAQSNEDASFFLIIKYRNIAFYIELYIDVNDVIGRFGPNQNFRS